jgi:hypothetical protein
MTTNRDFDRLASSWLAAGPTELNDRVLEAALDEVHLTNQRRRATVPWRTFTLSTPQRLAASIAIVAIVGVAGLRLLPGSDVGAPTTAPTASSATSATSPPSSPVPSPSPAFTSAAPTFPPEGAALAGTYRAGAPFQLPDLTFDVPAGWKAFSGVKPGVISLVIDSRTQDGSNGAFVNFEVPLAVFADPCRNTIVLPDLGPTVDDFITALSNLPKFTVGPVTDVLVDGLPGKQFDFTNSVPSTGAGCAGNGLIQVWSTGDVGGATNPGVPQHLVVVDVRGTRLVIEVLYGDPIGTFDDDINAIIDSVRFE